MTQAATKPTTCPLCGGPLLEHDASTPKQGAQHCNRCGSCWNAELTEQREGHEGPHVVISKTV